MKRMDWQIVIVVMLVLLSGVLYWLQYLLYSDARLFLENFLGYVAFLPLQVVLVSLVLERMLSYRDKRATRKKLNMVVGAFFSEVGDRLLRQLAAFDVDESRERERLLVRSNWPRRQFLKTIHDFRTFPWKLDSRKADLATLKSFLIGHRVFMLGLLENPSLLEHETFTELLWAVFHLTEELEARGDFGDLPETDHVHLSNDLIRAYRFVVAEWLAYLLHLSQEYPYLFSLALRTSPFDPAATAIVR